MSVTPKRPKGPPLTAMRAFEAAARHVSFVAAAEELSVTPGAISQQIKALEQWAGTPLFKRNAQGVMLTTAGHTLAPTFTAAFDAMAGATSALRNLKPDAEFHIAALPCAAQLWLPKRLAYVRSKFPQIKFSVTAMEHPPRLSRELFDLALFFGEEDGTPDQIRLAKDIIAPVCAPFLLNEGPVGTDGPNFDDMALLHDLTWAEDWALWSDAAGVPLRDPKHGAQFSLYSLAVEEAKLGAGVLIGHLCLLETALETGALAIAHPKTWATGQSLMLTMPPASQRRAETQAVAEAIAAFGRAS